VGKVLLSGCEAVKGRPCQTVPVKEGEIESSGAMEMQLGMVNAAKGQAGWDIRREGGSGALFTFECGKFPEIHDLQTVEGSAIAVVKGGEGSDLNKMSIKGFLSFKEKKGLQLPEMFEGSPTDVLSTTTTVGTSKETQQTGLLNEEELVSGLGAESGKEDPKNQEPSEVKTKGEVAP
jgi:hypothetical protein